MQQILATGRDGNNSNLQWFLTKLTRFQSMQRITNRGIDISCHDLKVGVTENTYSSVGWKAIHCTWFNGSIRYLCHFNPGQCYRSTPIQYCFIRIYIRNNKEKVCNLKNKSTSGLFTCDCILNMTSLPDEERIISYYLTLYTVIYSSYLGGYLVSINCIFIGAIFELVSSFKLFRTLATNSRQLFQGRSVFTNELHQGFKVTSFASPSAGAIFSPFHKYQAFQLVKANVHQVL